MNTISNYRKELKKIGFKLKTQTLSIGKFSTYTIIENNHSSSDLFNSKSSDGLKSLDKFKELREFIANNIKELETIAVNEDLNKTSFLLK